MAAHPDVVRVEPAMGTVFSFRLRGVPSEDGQAAIDDAIAEMRRLEAMFTTFRSDSEIIALRDGRRAWRDADPVVHEVAAACDALEAATHGRFSARWRGWFDPTGLVKGWAVDRAMRRHLAPLLERRPAAAAGIGAGGDILVRVGGADAEPWAIGIADPRRPGRIIGTIELADGAVATSGVAERGAHIVDPRTGVPAVGVLSATLVGDDLATTDAWATAAVVAGDDLDWIAEAPTRSGLVVAPDGGIRRWVGAAELVAPDPLSVPAA